MTHTEIDLRSLWLPLDDLIAYIYVTSLGFYYSLLRLGFSQVYEYSAFGRRFLFAPSHPVDIIL